MCFLALAAVLNIAGANIALLLRIPLYLDTLGTFLSAMLFGPFYGMIPGLLSGLLTGFTTDIYSLFYLPVQLVTALAAGFLFTRNLFKTGKYLILLYAVAVTVPGTIVSASITAFLFGGITSPVLLSSYSFCTIQAESDGKRVLCTASDGLSGPDCYAVPVCTGTWSAANFHAGSTKERTKKLWIVIVKLPIKTSGKSSF